ncbi:thioredoxin reductase-like selenoprotein T1b [Brevipalpus obovatus]|uniref:thioredoxin reductase-like selenoprotein T1b n=1 Tax=Brevipalpus obovatus TaxID=246614 RepID=UPI003D9EA236
MPTQGPQQFAMAERPGKWILVVLSVFLVMTAKDLISSRSQTSASSSDNIDNNNKVKSSPPLTPDANIIGGDAHFPTTKKISTMKFYYCISCGYAKAYQEYASLISENFPNVIVSGENYSTGTVRSLIANALNIARMGIIFLIIMNKNPFVYFHMATPQVWFWLTQHKIPGCLLIFFITNTLEANLMSSGAFEIFLNGKQIWSKLETGRVPSHQELLRMVAGNTQFGDDMMYMDKY